MILDSVWLYQTSDAHVELFSLLENMKEMEGGVSNYSNSAGAHGQSISQEDCNRFLDGWIDSHFIYFTVNLLADWFFSARNYLCKDL